MKKEELKPTDIIAGISNEWNRRSGNSVPPAYAAHNAKISGINRYQSAPNWSGQSNRPGNKSGGSSNQKKNNNKNQNQNNQNQSGKSSSKKKKGGKKQKGKGKQKSTQEGGQKLHAAVVEPLEELSSSEICTNAVKKLTSSAFEREMAGPKHVHMSYHYPTGSTTAPNPFQNTYDLHLARLEERIAANREGRPERFISVAEWNASRTAQIDEQVQQIDEAIASSASTANTEQEYDSDGDPMPTLVGVSSSENESENSYGIRSHSEEHIKFTMPHRQVSPETIPSVDRIEEGQNVEEEPTDVNIQNEEWPPHNAFVEYDPWATRLLPRDDPDQISKFMPENYNSDNKPTLNPTNRKIQWRFLENYLWDTKGVTDEIRIPQPHPEIFNGVRLAPPKAPRFYDIEDTWRNDDRKRDVMANTRKYMIKKQSDHKLWIWILIRTTNRIVMYPIQRDAVHNLTPRHALFELDLHEPILHVESVEDQGFFSDHNYRSWNVQHLSRVITDINNQNWISTVYDYIDIYGGVKNQRKTILQVFRKLKYLREENLPINVLNPIFWGSLVKLELEGKWLDGTINTLPYSHFRAQAFIRRHQTWRLVPRIYLREAINENMILYKWMNNESIDVPMSCADVPRRMSQENESPIYYPEDFMVLAEANALERSIQDYEFYSRYPGNYIQMAEEQNCSYSPPFPKYASINRPATTPPVLEHTLERPSLSPPDSPRSFYGVQSLEEDYIDVPNRPSTTIPTPPISEPEDSSMLDPEEQPEVDPWVMSENDPRNPQFQNYGPGVNNSTDIEINRLPERQQLDPVQQQIATGTSIGNISMVVNDNNPEQARQFVEWQRYHSQMKGINVNVKKNMIEEELICSDLSNKDINRPNSNQMKDISMMEIMVMALKE
ncbi:hypothetical protein PM082_023066 [Marasmius tenuissimus]|nr:hypothetical protein PM082_023066 [Marasmius tenuissimus]